MMKRKLFLGFVTISALSLSGCLSLLLPEPTPANHVYRLSSDLEASATANPLATTAVTAVPSVRIDRPNAPKALQGYDLVVSTEDNKLVTIARAEWADTLPTQIQRAFISHLNMRSDLIGILPTSGARSTYRGHITIRNFEARFDQGQEAAPLIIVDYLVTLSNAGSRNLIGTQSFHVEQRAASIRVSDIVASKSAANKAILNDISDWMVQKLSSQAG